MPRPRATMPAGPRVEPAQAALPLPRTPPNRQTAQPRSASVLVANPERVTRLFLSAKLIEAGFGRVLQAASAAQMHQVITRPPGELVLISLAFGADLDTMIADLRGAGWPRVLALARGRGTGAVIEACHRGVSGVLRGPPQGIAATTDRGVLPDVVPELSARGIEVLQWVADGRSNTWIAEQLHVSPDTVKSHLARIGRKLGTSHRAHMIAVAMRAGIIG